MGAFYWRTYLAALVFLVYLVSLVWFVVSYPGPWTLNPVSIYPFTLGLRSIRSQASL